MYCRKCGQFNNDEMLYCSNCGQALEKGGQQALTEKRKYVIVVLIILAVALFFIAAASVILLFFPSKGNNGKDQAQGDWVEVKETEDASEDNTVASQTMEAPEEKKAPVQSVEEYAAICRKMSKLGYSESADKELLEKMALTALQMEYVKGGNGAPKKLYTDLDADDDSELVYEIFRYFANDRRDLYKTTESGNALKKDAAADLVRDFYGKENINFNDYSYFEDRGDGCVNFIFGDGDPWYQLNGYSIKENQEFYLLEGACLYGDNGGDSYFTGYAKYLFRKNEDSSLGVTLVYSEFNHQENVNLAVSAKASSTLSPQGNKNYKAANLLDGNVNTCWVEGVSGTGVGETITLSLGKKRTVYGICIKNGYLETKYLYGINGKVTRVAVSVADGTTVHSDLEVLEFGETKEPFEPEILSCFDQWISFRQPVVTDTITVTIEGAVGGSKYEDTCISEISVY